MPVMASEMSGKKVIQKMTAVRETSSRFWSRKTASRETSESSRASLRSCSRLQVTSTIDPMTMTAISATKEKFSVGSETNAWIELRIPERTRKVPMTASAPLASTSEAFHTFSIPRFSWIMIE